MSISEKGSGNKVAPINEDPKADETAAPTDQIHDEEIKVPEESKVGKKLSDLTTRRVIILVLAMMFSVPFFTLTTYIEEHKSYEFGLELLKKYSDDTQSKIFNTTFDSYIDKHTGIRTPIFFLKIKNRVWEHESKSLSKLRSNEYEQVAFDDVNEDGESQYVAFFELKKNTILGSGLGIARTFFVCFVLSAGALLFSRDANELVIAPIEAMIMKVNKIAKNPLEAA